MQYDLVQLKRNEVFTNSWVIAEGTDNSHRAITAIIEKYQKDIVHFGKLSDHLKCHEVSGKKIKVYDLNEEQATFVITLLRNSKKVVEFKRNLVEQFYKMRRFILEKQSKAWIETRNNAKANRLKETDVIKQLAEYAKEQGSTHSDKLYVTYTKLAKTVVSGNRDSIDIMQLNTLTLTESIILQTIRIDMSMGMHYKDIYKDCKSRIEQFKDITYISGKEERYVEKNQAKAM